MRCLVVGGSGQDGILLTAQLLAEGHSVVSLSRRPSPLVSADHRTVDVAMPAAMDAIVAEVAPEEVYYLAAHHRSSGAERPPRVVDVARSLEVNATAFAALLESLARHAPTARSLYASSCRIFGLGDGGLLDESARMSPVCPYGLSKVAGMSVANVYRHERRMFVSSAIFFNHESELRPSVFLSKKLTLAALAARTDSSVRVYVESLDAEVDWGSARDYVAAMRCILRAEKPDEFVVASGELRTVREFAEACFGSLALDWNRHVVCVDDGLRHRWRLRGNPEKLLKQTDWLPLFGFTDMVRDLVTRTEVYERSRSTDFHSYL